MGSTRAKSPSVLPRRTLLNGVGGLALGVLVPAGHRAGQVAGMTSPALTGVVWQWQDTVAPDGTILWRPDQPDHYTVTFGADGTLAIQADCNRARGAYTADGATIALQLRAVTRMRCPDGSLMDQFLGELASADAWRITPDELALDLAGGETMHFTLGLSAPGTPAAE
jgi:heat shock protein HslJ